LCAAVIDEQNRKAGDAPALNILGSESLELEDRGDLKPTEDSGPIRSHPGGLGG
jgi:hypothetical protein